MTDAAPQAGVGADLDVLSVLRLGGELLGHGVEHVLRAGGGNGRVEVGKLDVVTHPRVVRRGGAGYTGFNLV